MIQKDGSIVIDNWAEGMGSDVFNENILIENADIFSKKGILNGVQYAENPPITGFGDSAGCICLFRDQTGYNIYLSQAGVITFEGASTVNQTLGIRAYDFTFYGYTPLGYAVYFVSYFQSGNLGTVGAIIHNRSANTITWINNIAINLLSGSGYYNIKLLSAKDGFVYYTNKNKIGKLSSIVITDTNVTATANNNVLDLDQTQYAHTMVEFGIQIFIGCRTSEYYPGQSFLNNTAQQSFIYKWDRVSSSFFLPISIADNGINAMAVHNNICYFSAGNYGNIYATDGTSYSLIKTINLNNAALRQFQTSEVYVNAFKISMSNTLLVGLSLLGVGNNDRGGVYEIALKQGYPMILRSTILDQGNTRYDYITIGALAMSDINSILIAVKSTFYSFSKVQLTNPTSGNHLRTTYISPYLWVGDPNNPKSYSEITLYFYGTSIGNVITIDMYRNPSDYTSGGQQLSIKRTANQLPAMDNRSDANGLQSSVDTAIIDYAFTSSVRVPISFKPFTQVAIKIVYNSAENLVRVVIK